MAFEQMLELRSARKVAVWLNEQGHRQKRFESRRRGDVGERLFTPAVVSHLLQDRHYLGEVSHSGDWFPGRHEPIIDAELFGRAQKLFRTNRKKGRRSTPADPHFYLLTGKVRCGACKDDDYALTTSSGKGKGGSRYYYYRCVSYSKKAKSKCSIGLIPAAKLEAGVIAVVREAARDPELVGQAIAETERIMREEMGPSRDRLDALRKDRDAAKAELDAGLRLLRDGDLGDVAYFRDQMRDADKRLQQLSAAIAEEEARLSEAEGRQLDLDLAVQALRGFDAAFAHLSPAEQKEFLDLMVDEVIVYPDHIEVALYEGSRASVVIEKAKSRVGKSKAKKRGDDGGNGSNGSGGSQNGQTPGRRQPGDQGFVSCIDWLPLVDRYRTMFRLPHGELKWAMGQVMRMSWLTR